MLGVNMILYTRIPLRFLHFWAKIEEKSGKCIDFCICLEKVLLLQSAIILGVYCIGQIVTRLSIKSRGQFSKFLFEWITSFDINYQKSKTTQ